MVGTEVREGDAMARRRLDISRVVNCGKLGRRCRRGMNVVWLIARPFM